MLIAIDIDDTLADFITSFIDFHNHTYGTSLTKDDIFTYDFWEVWGGTREETIKKIDDYSKTNYFKNVKPMDNAVKCVNELRQRHNLIVITSRPNSVVKETEEWINRYFPDAFSNIFYTANLIRNDKIHKTKEEVCINENVDVIIEDNLNHSMDCANKGIKVLLLDAPWNQSESLPKNITRVKSWDEIPYCINTLM